MKLHPKKENDGETGHTHTHARVGDVVIVDLTSVEEGRKLYPPSRGKEVFSGTSCVWWH